MVKAIAAKRPAVFSRIAFFALLLLMTATTLHTGVPSAHAAQTTLLWSAPTTKTDGTSATNLAGYKVHIGSATRSYQQKIDVGNSTSYTAGGLLDGSTYYFAVTAYDTFGVESAYSNEATKSFGTLPVTYSISATAGAGGTITAISNPKINVAASGTTTITSVTVSGGATQAFAIAAAAGYTVADVKVDGTSVGPVASYTFSNVTANHTIAVTFKTVPVASYSITATAYANGSISPAGTTSVASGSSKTYTITPSAGYAVSAVKADGISVGAVTSYTFSNVKANHSIAASFKLR